MNTGTVFVIYCTAILTPSCSPRWRKW